MFYVRRCLPHIYSILLEQTPADDARENVEADVESNVCVQSAICVHKCVTRFANATTRRVFLSETRCAGFATDTEHKITNIIIVIEITCLYVEEMVSNLLKQCEVYYLCANIVHMCCTAGWIVFWHDFRYASKRLLEPVLIVLTLQL